MPANMVFFRGHEIKYPISHMPAYFSSYEVASGYARGSDKTVSPITNTYELKLLDVRFMKDILRELFSTNPSDESCLSVILSFGICSLYHQYILAKRRFQTKLLDSLVALRATYRESLFEQPGVRIAETNNDAITMGFLKSLFEGFIDGFISPRQSSAFHIEKDGMMSPEMIIFDPIKVGLRALTTIPPDLPKISINQLYSNIYGKTINLDTSVYHSTMYTGGGVESELPSVEQIVSSFDTDENIRNDFAIGLEDGARWKKLASFGMVEPPVPSCKIFPWRNTQVKKRNKTRKQ